MKLDPENPQPGIYTGIPFTEYYHTRAISRSDLRHMQESPKYFHHRLTHPEPEPGRPLIVGDAAHAHVLEPRRFSDEYAVQPDYTSDPVLMLEAAVSRAIRSGSLPKGFHLSRPEMAAVVEGLGEERVVEIEGVNIELHPISRNTRLYRDAVADWELAHRGDVVITADEYADIQAWTDAVHADSLARSLLVEAKGFTELVVIFERQGVMCKCRIDRYVQWNGYNMVADYKTAREIRESSWARASSDYAYDWQAAMNLMALEYHEDVPRRFVDVCVRKSDDHDVVVYELEPADMELAMREVDCALARVAHCREKNCWPGIGDGKILYYSLPAWRRSC